MAGLSSTAGLVGVAALALSLVGLICTAVLAHRLGGVRRAQQFVLGEHGETDVVAHAQGLAEGFEQLHAYVSETTQGLDGRLATAERRLDGAVAHRALVRYDAYGEMSGRQSTSLALLDSDRSGVVLSSIHHRDQARLYVKVVTAGRGELELSPEEADAVAVAMGDRRVHDSA
jgi:hypothetical protein